MPTNDRAPPLGLALVQTAKGVSRAFDAALEAAGGSLPVWQVLLALVREEHATQALVAEAVGVRGPTLTHHLDRMERDGLLTRTRAADDRRAQRLTLTEKGRASFARMRGAAIAFDARLKQGLDEVELAQLREALARLGANVAGPE